VGISHYYGAIDTTAWKGFTITAAFIIFINIPILWVLKHITRRIFYEYFSILINMIEVLGYTSVIYFAGGIRGTYVSLIYAGVITYVGAVAPRRYPFIVAGFCAVAFSTTVLLEHFGYIPHQNYGIYGYSYKLVNVILILCLFTAALYVVAFISAYTSNLLRAGRHRLRQRNKELEQSRIELSKAAQNLEDKNSELQTAIEKARESERLKSQFLAIMSHEIRTPMNAVIGFSDMLLDTNLEGDQADYARTIESSGRILLALINDILDFSKIEAGELDFEEINFDPELLAYDVCEIIQPKIISKPIEILCQVGDSVPSQVRGDPLRVRQVLTNLMGNAAKFTESGEIELSLDIEEEKDEMVKFHAIIRDTGIGIPKEKVNTIFEAFQQADGSTIRKFGGTGLGLAISKQISNRMDGDVWTESEVGKGSTFHFSGWLKKTEDKEAKRFVPISLSGRKALIVDDNQTNLDILANVLQVAGMRVVALTRPEEVVPRLQEALENENPFDICIADIMMPHMSGHDLGEQIRGSQHQFSNIPLIALSSSMERDAKKCKEARFDGFLSKPFQKLKLFQMMERIMGEREEEGEKEEVVAEKIMTQYSVREDMKHSVRILLAEDNPVNQKLAKVMLAKAGYKVEVANNGKEAVEMYTSSPEDFDLIFMDIQMPEMDGIEATKAIREKGFDCIPIVAITAAAMKGDKEICLEAGMDDYITKPIKRQLVFEMLEKWIFKRKNH
jgi:signal transduction histidine kinase/CheY-like chemotaxis protein